MESIKNPTDFWFTIEPYVFVSIVDKCALLYNTLDGVTIETDKPEVIELLNEMLQERNCGVALLENERYSKADIYTFIGELREKYMGDIIDVTLSKGKPVQLLPYFNYPNMRNRKVDFSALKNMLDMLSCIRIHVDDSTDSAKLISLLQTMPENVSFDVIGNMESVSNELWSFFNQHPSPATIICAYYNVIALDTSCSHNFSYRVSVKFPVDMIQWKRSLQILKNQTSPFEFVFEITSDADCQQAEQLINNYGIENYCLNPVYTGKNIAFFEEHVFLTKEDILSTSISIKDLFAKQSMYVSDFGKITIMPNGNVYANVNYPALGNIYSSSLYEIISKEIAEGQSWLRIRNQFPCNACNYQWLCPSPSDYETAIGRPNLCHVK